MRIIICLLIVFFLFTSSSSYAAVNISIDSYPSSVIIGQEFSVSITANNLSSDTSYYIKGRIGIESDFNKAETNNTNNSSPDDWLSDNDSWSKFPRITVGDNISTWSGTLKLRAKNTATVGQNSLKVRIKKTTTDTTYDSSAYEINLQAAPTPTPTLTPTPTITPVPTSVPTSSPTSTGIPSATPTTKPLPTPTHLISPTLKKISPTVNLVISPTEYPTTFETTGTVLGENIEASNTGKGNGKELPILFLLLGSGIMFLVAAVLSGLKIRKNK